MRLPGLSIPGLGSLDWFPFVVTTPFQFISDYVFTYLDKAKEDEDESNENYRFFASPGRNPIPDRCVHSQKVA